MSDNNLPNEGMENENEEMANPVEETSDTYEEVNADEENAAAEDVQDEPVFDGEEAVSAAVLGNDAAAQAFDKAQKSSNKFKTSAIIAWILVVVLLAVDVVYYMTNIFNKYNHNGYLNVSGYSIGEVVAGMGMSFDDFKEMYGLPADMRKDTYMEAAQSIIPLSKMAELNGMDIETLKESYGFAEEINENSTWGEAIDSMALSDYVGEEQFEEFKTQYNLGDEVTLETKWGDIRPMVEKLQIAERLAQEAEASASPSPSASAEATDAPSEEPADASADTGAEADVTEAPAEAGEATDVPAADAE